MPSVKCFVTVTPAPLLNCTSTSRPLVFAHVRSYSLTGALVRAGGYYALKGFQALVAFYLLRAGFWLVTSFLYGYGKKQCVTFFSSQVGDLFALPVPQPAKAYQVRVVSQLAEQLAGTMLPADFDIEIAPNRKHLSNLLRTKCAPPDRENLEIWHNAWDRFSIEAFAQIPVPSCFAYSRKDSVQKRKNYTSIYKREAVRRLLPKFKERRVFLTGKAASTANAAIGLLESWKSELPVGTNLAPPFQKRPVRLKRPLPPEKIILPLPPTRFKKKSKPSGPKLRRHPGQLIENIDDFAGRALGKLLPPSPAQPGDNASSCGESSGEDIPSEFEV